MLVAVQYLQQDWTKEEIWFSFLVSEGENLSEDNTLWMIPIVSFNLMAQLTQKMLFAVQCLQLWKQDYIFIAIAKFLQMET